MFTVLKGSVLFSFTALKGSEFYFFIILFLDTERLVISKKKLVRFSIFKTERRKKEEKRKETKFSLL